MKTPARSLLAVLAMVSLASGGAEVSRIDLYTTAGGHKSFQPGPGFQMDVAMSSGLQHAVYFLYDNCFLRFYQDIGCCVVNENCQYKDVTTSGDASNWGFSVFCVHIRCPPEPGEFLVKIKDEEQLSPRHVGLLEPDQQELPVIAPAQGPEDQNLLTTLPPDEAALG